MFQPFGAVRSASRHIHEHGIWYHGYNVPELVVEEDYDNPRIDTERVEGYMGWFNKTKRHAAWFLKFFSDVHDDIEWRRCWGPPCPLGPPEKTAGSFYS